MSRQDMTLATLAILLCAALSAAMVAFDRYASADVWDLHDMCTGEADPLACGLLGPENKAELDAFWVRNGDQK